MASAILLLLFVKPCDSKQLPDSTRINANAEDLTEMLSRQAAAAATACLLTALGVYAMLQYHFKDLKQAPARRKADRLAINAAACFIWPAIALVILATVPGSVGVTTQVTSVVVLLYLVLDVRALVNYVGSLNDYQGVETLGERATQISTAAFAAGTLLLSSGGKDVVERVAPFVFLALLLCVISAVPSGNARRGITRRAVWDASQRSAVAFAAGLLALAIAVCVDVRFAD